MKHRSAPLPSRPAWRAHSILLSLALLLAAPASQAQSGEPAMGRAAWMSLAQGNVQLAPSDTRQWGSSETNRPLAQGDQLATRAGSRAELHVGSTALRLQGDSMLEFTRLDDYATQVKLTQGSLGLHLRELAPGERVEIDTPNLAFVATQPGEYRLDVDPNAGTTRVVVHSGGGTVYGANAEAMELSAAQQASFGGRNLAQTSAISRAWSDDFDRWATSRNQLDEQSISARYVSRDTTGYQQLDAYGDWSTDSTYGAVWFPRAVSVDWTPYRDGQWRWVAPWGWTWVDNAPWGFAPSHYGRWNQFGNRWGWVPGPRSARPVFGPGNVGFDGPGHRPDRPGTHWRPLRPGEPAPRPDRITLPLRPEPVRPSHIYPERDRPEQPRPWSRPGQVTPDTPRGNWTEPLRRDPQRPFERNPHDNDAARRWERDGNRGNNPAPGVPYQPQQPHRVQPSIGDNRVPDAPRQGGWEQPRANPGNTPSGVPYRPQRPQPSTGDNRAPEAPRPGGWQQPHNPPAARPQHPAEAAERMQRPQPSENRTGNAMPESVQGRFGMPSR